MVAVTDLYVRPSKVVLFDYLVAQLQAAKVPITDWEIGSIQRTIFEQCEAPAAFDLCSNALIVLASQQWPDTATAEWLTDLAHYVYELDRSLGTFAVQNVTLACATGYGPHVIGVNEELVTTDGKFYITNSGGTLSGGGTLSVQATARQVGPITGLVAGLTSPRPGVTIQSAAVATVSGVIRFGSDDESDAALLTRILARWPSLTAVANTPRVVRWALAADPSITRVKAEAAGYPNGFNVTLASSAGGVTGGALTAATTAIQTKAGIGKVYNVQSATTVAVQAAGTVWCFKGTIPAVQAAAQAAWATYLGTLTIGTYVSFSKLIACVMDAGAYDYQSPAMGPAGGPYFTQDIGLTGTQVPILPTSPPDLAGQLTWYDNL